MEGKKSKAGKIIKGCLMTLGGIGTLACAGYVIKEVKREYDETVDENNRLRDFINSHDFYNKEWIFLSVESCICTKTIIFHIALACLNLFKSL